MVDPWQPRYLLGIVAASMSTADGAIVALGTVFSHNLLRKTKLR